MHERTWDTAEQFLWTAKTWIFIGYSLPGADYEFKFLLKRIQLSCTLPPTIILITGGSGAESTEFNYQRFFGPHISKTFKSGLDDLARDYLHKLGSLRP